MPFGSASTTLSSLCPTGHVGYSQVALKNHYLPIGLLMGAGMVLAISLSPSLFTEPGPQRDGWLVPGSVYQLWRLCGCLCQHR